MQHQVKSLLRKKKNVWNNNLHCLGHHYFVFVSKFKFLMTMRSPVYNQIVVFTPTAGWTTHLCVHSVCSSLWYNGIHIEQRDRIWCLQMYHQQKSDTCDEKSNRSTIAELPVVVLTIAKLTAEHFSVLSLLLWLHLVIAPICIDVPVTICVNLLSTILTF